MHMLFTEMTEQRISLEFGSLVPVFTERLPAKLIQLLLVLQSDAIHVGHSTAGSTPLVDPSAHQPPPPDL